MNSLAATIRREFETLLDDYDRRLQAHPAYAAMPAEFRREAARRTLNFVADWLQSSVEYNADDTRLIQFIQATARERTAQGLDVGIMQPAVDALEAILDPLITDVETAKLVWRTLSQARQAITQQVADMFRRDITERQRLEQQIQESLERRGRQVQTSTEVAQEIAAAPALDELFNRVVTLIKERFGYYHAQIFRYEPAQDAVVLVAGYGETGRKMLAAGHKLVMGRGVVGTAAATAQSILASDVAQDTDWQPNPNLPETHGELAVPIKLRDQVLGILDVQSTQAGVLTAEDQLSLEGLCGQIAIAIENKRTEAALTREQYLMNALMANVPAGIYFKDTASRFIRASMATVRAFGLSHPADLIGKSDFDFFTEEHARPAFEDEQEIMRTGQSIHKEERETRTDGRDTWALTTKLPLRDEAGRTMGTFGITLDITDRKQVEAQIQASQEQLAILIENAPEAILVLDADTGLFLTPNENAVKLYGLDRDALTRVGLLDTSPPTQPDGRPSAQVAASYIANALSGGTPRFEWMHRNAAGQLTPCEVHLVRLPAAGRNLLRVSIADITERKQAEQALVEQSRLSAFEAEVRGIITSSRPMRDKLQRCAQAMVAHLDAAFARVWTLNTTLDILELQASAGLYTHVNGAHGRIPLGHYKIGLIASRREPHLTNAAMTDPEVSDHAWAQREGLVAFAGYPLIAGQRLLGVIGMFARQPLSEHILNTLQGISLEIALGLEREQAEVRMQETLRELERLNRAATREGWQAFREAAQVTPGYLFDRMNLTAQDTQLPQIEQAIQRNTFVPPSGKEHVAVAPLAVRGQVIGAVGIYDDPERPLAPDEIELVKALAEQGAQALEAARLFEQTQASLTETRTLNDIAARLNTATSLEQILQASAAPGIASGASHAGMWLFEPDASGKPEWMTFAASWTRAGPPPTPLGTRLRLVDFPSYKIWINETGQPTFVGQIAGDERVDERLRATFERTGIQAVACMPLTISGRWIGVTIISFQTRHAFTANEQPLYRSIAAQAAVAIENRRLLEQTRTALAELEATQRAYLRGQWESYLVEYDAGEAALGAARRGTRKTLGFVEGPTGLQADNTIWLPEMDQAIQRGETVTLTVAQDAARDARAAMALPIKLRGESIGVLEFYDQDSTRTWNEDERALAQTLADQAALALENARLFEDTQSRAQREQLINTITTRIRASTDMEAILRTTAEELTRTLNLSSTRIRLNAGHGSEQ